MRRRRMVPVALAALLLVGCSGNKPTAPPSQSPSTSATSTRSATTLRLADKREVRDPGATSVHGDVFGGRAVWAAGPNRRFDSIVAVDLATGKKDIVLTSKTRHIDWVRGHGDTIVYRELSGRLDSAETLDWTIKTFDLNSKQTKTVATSARPSSTIPAPVISAGAIAWVEGEEGKQELRVLERGSGSIRTVLRSRLIAAVALEGDLVFVVDAASKDRPVITLPMAGGEPTELIPGAQAIDLRVSPSHIAYVSGANLTGDPEKLVVFDRASRQSIEVTDSTSTMFALGDGFVAWHPLGESRIVAVPLGDVAKQVVLQPADVNVPLGLDAEGEWVLWGESRSVQGAGVTNRVFTGRLRI